MAVAVTVTPPADAVAVFGPNVVALRVTHSHIGIPTTYLAFARGLATLGPSNFMESTARCATTAGSTVGPAARGAATK
ncbi:hypothetical protein ACFVZD_44050 [Streptomyces sp. NPDC058287]|uniref:hypothetical protein n=1 Tax=unclassified Streptomyces TaxID=2593676 RepID=UPI0036E77A5D